MNQALQKNHVHAYPELVTKRVTDEIHDES